MAKICAKKEHKFIEIYFLKHFLTEVHLINKVDPKWGHSIQRSLSSQLGESWFTKKVKMFSTSILNFINFFLKINAKTTLKWERITSKKTHLIFSFIWKKPRCLLEYSFYYFLYVEEVFVFIKIITTLSR